MGEYSGFDKQGTYIIVIKATASIDRYSYVEEATITQTIYSPALYTSVTQSIGTNNIELDEYETDDTYDQASIVILNSDEFQSHTFHSDSDVDWVEFYGVSGETYNIFLE